MSDDKLQITSGAPDGRGVRTITAKLGALKHRDKFDPDSESHRRRFREKVTSHFDLTDDAHAYIEQVLTTIADDSAPGEPDMVKLNDVKTKPIHWMWDGYFPAGSIVVLDGDPNEGKSQLSLSIAARVSTGCSMPPNEFPGASEPADVLILSAEDDLQRTTKPRLEALGADLSRVHYLRTITDVGRDEPRLVELPRDIPVLEQVITTNKIVFVVIDVLSAFIGDGFNMNSDGDMRRCLTPISAMAERTQAAVLLLRHMNKREGTKSMYRGGGSVAIIGAARAAFAVAPHPDDADEKVFAAIKHNLGPRPASLTYSIEPFDEVSRIVWGGQTELSAADVLKQSAAPGANKFEQAKEIILDILGAGPRGSNEVEGAIELASISRSTYWRARDALGVKADKTGYQGQWLLSLPSLNGEFQP